MRGGVYSRPTTHRLKPWWEGRTEMGMEYSTVHILCYFEKRPNENGVKKVLVEL